MKKRKRCISWQRLMFQKKTRDAIVLRVALICSTLFVSLDSIAQNQLVSISVNQADVGEVFSAIKSQTNLNFMYNVDQLKEINPVTLKVKNVIVDSALHLLFAGTPFTFTYNKNTIVITKKEVSDTQATKTVSGKVTDKAGNPLPGVTVIKKGSVVGTSTDNAGMFKFPVAGEEKTVLVFSFIGMKSVERTLTPGKHVHIHMEEDSQELEEVVSYGYYTVDKRYMTSAVTSLKAEDILMPGVSTIDQMLEGHVPGLIFMQNSGQVGAAPKLKIRGTTTLLGNQSPLWVLDGIILSDPVNIDPTQLNDLDFVNLLGNAISGVNPEDIEQIDVLKDASATAIYGPRASNGVIVITTKKGKIGKPSVTYSLSGTFRRRPRYTDKAVNVMNSQERIAYSREAIESKQDIPNPSAWIGYEAAYYDYNKGVIGYDEFIRRVRDMETSNTDWLGLLMSDTYSHSHTLSLSGGTENIRYYASVGYTDEQGNIKAEESKRYSGMARLDLNYNKFTAQFSLNGSLAKRYYTPSEVGVADYAYNTARSIPAYNEDGSLLFYQKNDHNGLYDKPFSILHEQEHTSQDINSNSLGINVSLSYRLLSMLRAEVTFGYNISDTDQETLFDEKSWYIANLKKISKDNGKQPSYSLCPAGGELRLSNTRNETYSARARLTFNKMMDPNEYHQLTANLIGEVNSSHYRGFSITRRGYLPDRGLMFDLIDPGSFPDYDSWLSQNAAARGVMTDNLTRLVGLIGSVSYTYKNAFILNANARIDGSNKFGDESNKRLNPIWSVSGRWNMEQDLFKNVYWINSMALKMSYGYQGNMSAQESPRLIIKKMGTDKYFKEYYSKIQNYPNPNLKWEKTSNFNVELEFAMFNEKLHAAIGYYYRYTKDAFLQKRVSAVNGVKQYTVNEGDLKNQGVEFLFNFTPINNLTTGGSRRGFVWKIDPNFGSVFNQLIDKVKTKDKVLHEQVTFRDYLDGNVQVVGRPNNTFYSYRFKGLNPVNGAPLFYNTEKTTIVNGEEVETASIYQNMEKEDVFTTVLTHSGCREPFLQGGIYNYFGYGNWSLSFNLNYSIGSKIRLFKLYPRYGDVVSPEQNLRKELSNRWKRPGDEMHTNIPGILSKEEVAKGYDLWCNDTPYDFADNIWQMYDESDIRVVSGNYLKLSSLSLRYIIPDKFCKKLHMRSAYVSFSGTNIFTLCSKKLKGQDPSQSGTTDLINISVRPTYSLQLNVTF
ncbi:MAG: SusC/RagA family TonB-linked outer membrane protein [Odoribacter splanchnicus]